MDNKIPDFAGLAYDDLPAPTIAESGPKGQVWQTPEGIAVRPVYGEDDLAAIAPARLHTLPGLPPFTRGPYATMYTQRP
ncbi:MAG TPA: methylmalonyl-CoA mutase family protein, partial [Nannocystis sp.]